jgi:hypothetical protein
MVFFDEFFRLNQFFKKKRIKCKNQALVFHNFFNLWKTFDLFNILCTTTKPLIGLN